MSSKNIATENRQYSITPNGTWIPGTINPNEVTSTSVKCSGSKVLIGPIISWTMSGCVFPGYTFISGFGSMSPTASKVTCSFMKPFREDDEGNCNGIFNLATTPFTPMSCSCKVKIASAGQTKVKAV